MKTICEPLVVFSWEIPDIAHLVVPAIFDEPLSLLLLLLYYDVFY